MGVLEQKKKSFCNIKTIKNRKKGLLLLFLKKCNLRNGFDIEKLRGKRGRATSRRLRKIAKICKTTYTLLRRSSELRTHFVTQFPTAAVDGVVVHQSQYALVSKI